MFFINALQKILPSARKIFNSLKIPGFTKITDHRPTDLPTTYYLPTDPPTTYPQASIKIKDQSLNMFFHSMILGNFNIYLFPVITE